MTITGHCVAGDLVVICFLSDFSNSQYFVFLMTMQPNRILAEKSM